MAGNDVSESVKKDGSGMGELIARLEEIQAKYSYLPEAVLRQLAKETGRSLVDIYGVATFYRAFSLEPRGKHLVSVCLGTACHVRGGAAIAQEIQQQLKIKAGETTADKEFTLETVNCLGACAIGPVIVVDGHYFPGVKTSMVKGILEQTRQGLDKIEVESDQRVFPLEVSCARCNHSLMDARHVIDGRPPIKVTVSFGSTHGWLMLSSLYGSHEVSMEYEIPPDTIVHMFCPHCHAELIGGAKCGECDAPMVPMIVRGGGVVQICSRRGCKGHMLDLGGVSLD
ncbi:MAG: NAD(P)H-dependent oxidoreductase subunit E [Candidatus Zixiibacteriota bacterium]|nr:MAG: NAD(P)H-dependent oxidoreductase subunit E [candidate division Zixibacteria bacterium]